MLQPSCLQRQFYAIKLIYFSFQVSFKEKTIITQKTQKLNKWKEDEEA
jgi:hypothetical protein